MEESTTRKYPQPTWSQLFFWWMIAANTTVLRDYPNNWTQITAQGIYAFAVSVVASCFMTLVLGGVFGVSSVYSIIGGVFWGFGVVLSLERLILGGYRKTKAETVSLIYRLAVIVVLSLIITDSAMLYILRDDIKAELITRDINEKKAIQENSLTEIETKELSTLFTDEGKQQGRLDRLNQDMQEKLQIRDAEGRGDTTFTQEDGTVVQLSGRESHGSEYANRNKEYEAARLAFESQSDTESDGTIAHNLKRIRDRKELLLNKTNKSAESLGLAQQGVRLLEMHGALIGILLKWENLGALIFFIFFWVGDILIQSALILSKYTTGITRYDWALINDDRKAELLMKHDETAQSFLDATYQAITSSPDDRERLSTAQKCLLELIENNIVADYIVSLSDERARNGKAVASGESIKVRIAGDDDLRFKISISREIENIIRFDDLLKEQISEIEREVRLAYGDVVLERVTDTNGKEIERTLMPLIPQIDADRCLVLHFSSPDDILEATNVTS